MVDRFIEDILEFRTNTADDQDGRIPISFTFHKILSAARLF